MTHLQSPDGEVASAAAVALGNIGGEKVATELAKYVGTAPAAVRSSVAEGCILAAERLSMRRQRRASRRALRRGSKSRPAEAAYRRSYSWSDLARGVQGVPLLLDQLHSADKEMFEVGLWTARELPGKEIVNALVDEVGKAAPEKAALIVLALADRKGTLDLPTLIKIASSGPSIVRIAAMSAISRVGDVTVSSRSSNLRWRKIPICFYRPSKL